MIYPSKNKLPSYIIPSKIENKKITFDVPKEGVSLQGLEMTIKTSGNFVFNPKDFIEKITVVSENGIELRIR